MSSNWDKLWEKIPLPITDQWGRTDTGPLLVFLMEVKTEGDQLQEKQRETRFLLSCESDMHRDCRLQLGDYMKKFNIIKQMVQEYEYGEIDSKMLHHKLVEILEV